MRLEDALEETAIGGDNADGDYIRFEDRGLSEDGETRIWRIYNSRYSQTVGWIRWHPLLHRYCFHTEDACFYDAECLRLVAEFTDAQMQIARRARH